MFFPPFSTSQTKPRGPHASLPVLVSVLRISFFSFLSNSGVAAAVGSENYRAPAFSQGILKKRPFSRVGFFFPSPPFIPPPPPPPHAFFFLYSSLAIGGELWLILVLLSFFRCVFPFLIPVPFSPCHFFTAPSPSVALSLRTLPCFCHFPTFLFLLFFPFFPFSDPCPKIPFKCSVACPFCVFFFPTGSIRSFYLSRHLSRDGFELSLLEGSVFLILSCP